MAELPGLSFIGKRTDQCSIAKCEELGDDWEFAFTAAVPMVKGDGEPHIEEIQVVAKFCPGHSAVFHPVLTGRTEDWTFSISVPTGATNDFDV